MQTVLLQYNFEKKTKNTAPIFSEEPIKIFETRSEAQNFYALRRGITLLQAGGLAHCTLYTVSQKMSHLVLFMSLPHINRFTKYFSLAHSLNNWQ